MARTSREFLQPGRRIRVLVVDDSVVIRQLVTHAIEPDKELEIVGVAANGAIAISKIPQLNPDVLTLDIEMPEMDGLETLRRIRKEHPKLRVVMFSTLTQRGAAITLDALALGADDYVTKVSNEGSLDRSLTRLREELIPKIKQFFALAPTPGSSISRPPSTNLPGGAASGLTATGMGDSGFPGNRAASPAAGPSMSSSLAPSAYSGGGSGAKAGAPNQVPQVVTIGVSTGGPNALAEVLPAIPGDFPLPILLVQHMPPLFTRLLAERLNTTCKLKVHEATDGEPVEPGKILIAPGDYHMKIAGQPGKAFVRLDKSPPQNSCRPAVDALFTSVAEVYGGGVITVMLTGMGSDGLIGTQVLKASGAFSIAQDQESSVVWGMPGAVTQAGVVDAVLPLKEIAGAIVRAASRRAPNRPPQQAHQKEAQW